jgi:hypothetical protein
LAEDGLGKYEPNDSVGCTKSHRVQDTGNVFVNIQTQTKFWIINSVDADSTLLNQHTAYIRNMVLLIYFPYALNLRNVFHYNWLPSAYTNFLECVYGDKCNGISIFKKTTEIHLINTYKYGTTYTAHKPEIRTSVAVLIQPTANGKTAAVIRHTYPTFEITQQKKNRVKKFSNDLMRMVLRKKNKTG